MVAKIVQIVVNLDGVKQVVMVVVPSHEPWQRFDINARYARCTLMFYIRENLDKDSVTQCYASRKRKTWESVLNFVFQGNSIERKCTDFKKSRDSGELKLWKMYLNYEIQGTARYGKCTLIL